MSFQPSQNPKLKIPKTFLVKMANLSSPYLLIHLSLENLRKKAKIGETDKQEATKKLTKLAQKQTKISLWMITLNPYFKKKKMIPVNTVVEQPKDFQNYLKMNNWVCLAIDEIKFHWLSCCALRRDWLILPVIWLTIFTKSLIH